MFQAWDLLPQVVGRMFQVCGLPCLCLKVLEDTRRSSLNLNFCLSPSFLLHVGEWKE